LLNGFGARECIAGATTLDEYRKYIEKDAALERRFQKVLVEEPSVESTIAIPRGLQEKYELHHGVEITDPAIVPRLSFPIVTSRPFPGGQAIDLIDEAARASRWKSIPSRADGKLERRLISSRSEAKR